MIIENFLDKSICPSLLLFPVANVGLFFVFSGKVNEFIIQDAFMVIKQVTILIFVAIAEELFFRGLLLRELVFGFRLKAMLAATIVSMLFGVLHIMNIFSYASVTYAIIQGVCAFSVGFDLSAIYCKFRSIIPCIVIHALINITSIGLENVNTKLTLTNLEVSVFLLVAVLYLLHGYREFKSMNL